VFQVPLNRVPAPVLEARVFDLSFILADPQKPFNAPTRPFNPQFMPFTAKYLTI